MREPVNMIKTVVLIRSTSIYNDSRATKEILSLSKGGYHVIVLGWNRDGVADEKCHEIFSDDVQFYFYGTQLKNIGFRNIGKLACWFMWVCRQLNSIIDRNNVTIIHACDLDAGLPAWWFVKQKGKHNIKFVYDIYDYYVDSHSIPSLIRNNIENLEIAIINQADLTIICNEERKWQIRHANPRELLVIHNSPDLRNIELPEYKEKYDYAYCGSLAPVRLLKEIFNAYDAYQDICMVIAGFGIYDTIAQNLASRYENFSFKGVLSYSDVLKVEASSKVLSAIYDPSITNHKLAAPNKFYESMALGKPLIVCKGTGIDKIVKQNDLGIVISYDEKEFFSSLKALLSNYELRRDMGIKAKSLFTKRYSWNKMEHILLTAYDAL